MSVIDEFLEHYNREFDHYAQAASLVQQKLEAGLTMRGIHAIVTSRAKGSQRLRAKLAARESNDPYPNIKAIYADIIDLAGVRVALYFPADKDNVDALIEELFSPVRAPKNFPQKKSPKDGKRFMGYLAVHHLVKPRSTGTDSTDARYADTRVEIQVASVLMHAWAEVEHDLEYKPETGVLSEDESAILDEINGLVLSGELALESLQRAIQRRTAKQDVEFRDQFELASFLSQRTTQDRWNNRDVGKVDVLFVALKHLRKATPRSTERYLVQVSDEDRSRPVADVLIDKLLASNEKGASELPSLIGKSLGFLTFPFTDKAGSEQRDTIGSFLLEWRQAENLLKKLSTDRGQYGNSPLTNVNQLKSDALREELHRIRILRNTVLHGSELPPSSLVNDASHILRARILPDLKELASKNTRRFLARAQPGKPPSPKPKKPSRKKTS